MDSSIKDLYFLDDGRQLHCSETVRLLPGKRRASIGTLEGRPVFVKCFLDQKRGQVHWQRELNGIKAFWDRGILTAELLYVGQEAEHGWPLIVLAQIPDPISLKDAWQLGDDARREHLLREMVSLLAQHHRAGLRQTDLHLDNFVLSQGEIFSLDGAGVTDNDSELGLADSLENIALLIAQLHPEWEAQISNLYDQYFAERDWSGGPGYVDLLKSVGRWRKRRWREHQGKLLRECTDFVCRQEQGRFEVIARSALNPAMESLLAAPDSSFPGKEWALKNGNTCTVWATNVNDLSLVIKRYNVKGSWHGLKLATRKGRAFRSWENAHRLVFYGIATPHPVALVKIKHGLLKPMSYFIAEQVDGVGAQEWFRDESISWTAKIAMAEKINQLLLQLEAQRISHGDLKASNILIVGDRPVLIDLDAMQQHASTTSFRKSWGKDLRRFMRNWDDAPDLKELFAKVG
ncbi:serine/threonine protein kinase [hydrothermal vent metagenome]|uniref:Serine/threonine protein kinase n=1 Tax=hydrothermal vent metagenome TaxID=652676 RepID=A0A3B1AUU4_9ZZZZ